MNAQATPAEVFALDARGQFQPIRLPAASFEALHRDTLDTLRQFVKAHRERFPQGPIRRKPKPR